MTDIVPLSMQPIALATTISQVIQNCDKDVPLASGDSRFVDLAVGRGDAATGMVVRNIQGRAPGQFAHIAFVSHRGAGKSTEIHRIEHLLAETCQIVYLEATVEMDSTHIDAEDLLLNIALAVEREMRKIGKPLPQDLLDRVEKWFAEAVKTTSWVTNYNAELAAGTDGKMEIPFLLSLFAQAKALLKYESHYRNEVKQVLQKYPGTLLQSVNELLDAAHQSLDGRRIVIIVDNMDRYDPKLIDQLLVVGADRVRSLRCHLILTPPISLLLQPQAGQLDEHYKCFDLFTVRLRRRDQRYDEFDGPGRDLLEAALAKRIDMDVMIPSRELRDRLIAASGGAIRELLDLVSLSANYTNGDAIDEASVERAIARRKQRLRDQININGWWPALREIAETKQVSNSEHCLSVLFYRLAFKYNGEGWYDVHPLITELPEFRRA